MSIATDSLNRKWKNMERSAWLDARRGIPPALIPAHSAVLFDVRLAAPRREPQSEAGRKTEGKYREEGARWGKDSELALTS
jgi:hypothetical protein